MSAEEQANVLCFWNALVIATGLYYFGYGLGFSLLIAVVVLISSLIGYGRRHLVRGGFALMVIAIAVSAHALPPPDQWVAVLKSAQLTVFH